MTTLYLLAPHLYTIYREAAVRRRRPVHLTEHELDVLHCVALGVSSRAAAVARVFPEPEAL